MYTRAHSRATCLNIICLCVIEIVCGIDKGKRKPTEARRKQQVGEDGTEWRDSTDRDASLMPVLRTDAICVTLTAHYATVNGIDLSTQICSAWNQIASSSKCSKEISL